MEKPGFHGDLISVDEVSILLRSNGIKLAPQAIPTKLKNIDYIRHPAAENSRGVVKIDGRSHRIYVKKGSLAAELSTPAEVSAAYKQAHQSEYGPVALADTAFGKKRLMKA